MRQLRVLQVVVQTVLAWDDGDELEPGPQLDPVALKVSQLAGFAESLPAEVEKLAEKLRAEAGQVDVGADVLGADVEVVKQNVS